MAAAEQLMKHTKKELVEMILDTPQKGANPHFTAVGACLRRRACERKSPLHQATSNACLKCSDFAKI